MGTTGLWRRFAPFEIISRFSIAKQKMQEPNSMIKAVLFDFGETLVNFGQVSTTRLFRQSARMSYDFLKALDQPLGNFEWYCWRNLISLRLRHLFTNMVGRDFDALKVLRKSNEKRGVRLDDKQWRELVWIWYEPLTKVSWVETGTKQMLTELKKMGLKLGIVSNTFVHASSLEKHLQQLSILDFFDVRLYSYQFNFRKPDLRIFETAAQRIGEEFKKTLFIGDRIDKDIKPALGAGMYAVLKEAYTNVGQKTPKGAWKINQLAELPALIEKINKKEPCR